MLRPLLKRVPAFIRFCLCEALDGGSNILNFIKTRSLTETSGAGDCGLVTILLHQRFNIAEGDRAVFDFATNIVGKPFDGVALRVGF